MSMHRFQNFLRRASLLALVMLASCGGSDDGGLPPDLPFEEKAAAIELVQTELAASDLDYSSFEAGAAAFAAKLKASGKFKDTGFDVSEDRLVWMRLADGTTIVIPFNRKPSGAAAEKLAWEAARAGVASPAPAVAAAIAVGYPGSPQSALLNTFLSGDYQSGITAMRPLLTSAGYTQVTGGAANTKPLDGSLLEFLNLQDAGVIYVDGHGVSAPPSPEVPNPSGENWLYLGTRSDYTAELAKGYEDDFKAGLLIVGIEPSNGKSMVMMSDEFVKAHVKVAPKALVFLNTCWNGTRDRMAKAFFAGGAGTVLGWDRKVEDEDAYGTGLYFFDRLLGIRSLIPPAHGSAEPAWPTLIAEVFSDMSTAIRPGRIYSFASDRLGAKLKTYSASDTSRQILPSIRVVTVDQANNLLKLHGEFGPDTGSVTGNPGAGGVALQVISWTESQITVASVAGVTRIQVSKGTLLSNIAGVPNADFTFAEESIPSGSQQVLLAHVDIPKSPLARGTLGTTLIVNNVDKLQYVVGFQAASAPIALANTNFSAYLAPGSNIVTSLDNGNYTFPSLYQGFPLVYDNGDRLVVVLGRAFYGGSTGLTLGDAQTSLHNFTSTIRLRITKSLFDPVNTQVTFVAP
jgi:hypothetical protein